MVKPSRLAVPLAILGILAILDPLPCVRRSAVAQAITGPAGTYISSVVLPKPGPVTISGTWSGPAGTYTITIPSGAVITQTDTSITITWGPAPGPSPIPNPPSPSPQNPTTGPYTVVFVADRNQPNQLSSVQVALSTSPTIGASLKAINPANQWVSMDVSAPTLAGWRSAIVAAGTPCVLVIGTDNAGAGFKVESIPNPADESSVVAEIRRLASGGAPR